jgi:hypothetical protein
MFERWALLSSIEDHFQDSINQLLYIFLNMKVL